jgi:putative ABC transport system permease protein
MERLVADLRVSVRSLRRSPGFVAATSAILAIGIGMAAAMYTVYHTVLVARLPVAQQERLVVMHPLDKRGTHLDVPFPYLAEIARDTLLFRAAGGPHHLGAQYLPFMEEGGATPLNLAAVGASPNYFDVLGIRPALGRLFQPEDGRKGAPPVIVLSYAAWQRYFRGDPAVVSRTLIIPYTEKRARIVGVLPPGFTYPTGTDAWLPFTPDITLQVDIVARLAPNVTVDAARQGLFALTQRVNPFAGINPGPGQKPLHIEVFGVEAQSLVDTVLGTSRPTLVALTLAVGLLLLIACVNVGNLMLVRLRAREREIAVRHAIGATHADVARLFLIESAILAALGGTLGCLLAAALINIVRVLAPPELPRLDTLTVANAPLAATAGIIIFATLVFGVMPSIMGSRVRSYALLRADVRAGTETSAKRRGRRLLVATQMALALVMLSGAALLVRTLVRLESMDLGYRPEHLSVLSFTGPQSRFSNDDQVFTVAQQLTQRLEATPGVVAATPIESNPFKGQSLYIMKLVRAELPAAERENAPFIPWEFVGPDYFRTFRIPIRRGRGLLSSDTKGADNVVVVNESLARQFWPGQDPLGKRVVNMTNGSAYTVVGVAEDTHFRELKRTGPVAYFNTEQMQPFWNGLMAVRTSAPLGTMMPALRAAIRDVEPSLVLFDVRTMDELLDAPLAQPRLSALVLTGFSLVALLLSAIGLYGVMSATVRQQTRDIGVRIALGATTGDVYRLVLNEAIGVIGAGAVVGILGSALGGRLLAAQLFQVSSLDPVALCGAAVMLLAIGIGAAFLPARRATRVDPVTALRAD